MKNKNKIIIPVVAALLIIFLTIIYLVTMEKTILFDEQIYNILPKNDAITTFMKLITKLGSTIGLSILAILLFLFVKDKRKSILFPLNLSIIGSLNHILKFIIARPRPINQLVEASGYSFPSGHSASSLAFYGFLMYYIYKKCPNKYFKVASLTILSFLILLIGISRIYLHVHYPTDVIGGFTYSLAYLIIFIKLTLN